MKPLSWIILCVALLGSTASVAEDVLSVRLFFGLSLPSGGAVSLADWESFQQKEIVPVFDGFNVVDSIGYYQGKPERSKLVTVILPVSELEKARSLASLYAKQFKQDSVMLVSVPVVNWQFIGSDH